MHKHPYTYIHILTHIYTYAQILKCVEQKSVIKIKIVIQEIVTLTTVCSWNAYCIYYQTGHISYYRKLNSFLSIIKTRVYRYMMYRIYP